MRGDSDETFFNYEYYEAKSKILFCYGKDKMPNAFIGTRFNKHFLEIMITLMNVIMTSFRFFFPSTTDRKDEFNQYLNNISLSRIDWSYDGFQTFKPNYYDFSPADLHLKGEERKKIVQTMYNFLKHIIEL